MEQITKKQFVTLVTNIPTFHYAVVRHQEDNNVTDEFLDKIAFDCSVDKGVPNSMRIATAYPNNRLQFSNGSYLYLADTKYEKNTCWKHGEHLIGTKCVYDDGDHTGYLYLIYYMA